MSIVKVYYAGEVPSIPYKVGLFLGGATLLGNSWRSEVVKEIVDTFNIQSSVDYPSLAIFVPEPRDSGIKSWGQFYEVIRKECKHYDQVEWEKVWGATCKLWTMYMPLYVNKFQATDLFAMPESSAERSHPIAVKALQFAFKSNEISETEFQEAIDKLTNANLGCQVRFEAGYLCGEAKKSIVWGSTVDSAQINFVPYLPKDVVMHKLTLKEKASKIKVPPSFIAELKQKLNQMLFT